MGKLLTALQADMTEIKEANAGLRTDVDGILLRLDEAENRISQLEDEGYQLRNTADKTAKKCDELHHAVEDAANRDRRQNLRLVSLREKLENGRPTECARKIISEALGVELDGTQLQRVHRAPIPMPIEDRPPRPIIMRFLSFLEQERVLAAAKETFRKKEDIIWGGCKLSFFQKEKVY
ncbi:LINE-1 retrotransposable element ORF1 protein [Dissostichus eleginoides]|uniref:LINE-1 retrotransposable element ORF1 protein n=1 Tax=Dissostichus eleginoides TaxID=100907 RepID=A0AAD9FIB3_DISEL|nr:LINE-1 retrotransposable element ORF1 protein [Dissostichus eleginoides]